MAAHLRRIRSPRPADGRARHRQGTGGHGHICLGAIPAPDLPESQLRHPDGVPGHSELFGHVRGAFTGADYARPGKFRLAHGGSLFLDEVGDMPLAIQPKLLRAVEQGEIEPVGGDAAVKVDVRLVSASNQDLPRLVAQGRFRQDLYDRLAVLAIHLPPLRERPSDILLLAGHFARETARRYGRGLSPEFTQAARRRLRNSPGPEMCGN